jgi:hypothetical protein
VAIVAVGGEELSGAGKKIDSKKMKHKDAAHFFDIHFSADHKLRGVW